MIVSAEKAGGGGLGLMSSSKPGETEIERSKPRPKPGLPSRRWSCCRTECCREHAVAGPAWDPKSGGCSKSLAGPRRRDRAQAVDPSCQTA